MKLWKRLGAVMLSAALLAGISVTGASACTSLYVGSDLTQNGSTYFGRGEDIGEEWTKVFQVIEAADHAEGEMYENVYGFSIPYPEHTYRYTYVRDSLDYEENVTDDDGNVLIPAYAQAGINELGVSLTATVSTLYDNDVLDSFDPPTDKGICEQDIAGVILQSATSARHGVEILAAVLDEYGAGYDYNYYNFILIGDTEEVWSFQVVSAHNYVAVRLPSDKVSINPNIVTMGEVDVSDTENVIASENLISMPLENGFLVSSQYNAETKDEDGSAEDSDAAETIPDEPAVEDTNVADETVFDEATVEDTDTDETVSDEATVEDTDADETATEDTGADETVSDEAAAEDTDANEIPTTITKINIRETYGTNDGIGQYTRYWQGVNYLNSELAAALDIGDGKTMLPSGDAGISFLFEPDRQMSTYDVLRFFAARGEDTKYDSNANPRIWPIGNEHQAEVHVFEVRHDSELPAELATIEWLALNRAEYSVFLPFYSALLTDTSEVYQSDWTIDDGSWDVYGEDIEIFSEDWLSDPSELPENSMFWAFAAINDLCDNDRERYGANVKLFWETYQNALIAQQETVDAAMLKLYNSSPAKAEEAATELGKAVAEETYGYAQQILTELWAFIQADEAGDLAADAVFTPSVLTEGVLPTYASAAAEIIGDLTPSTSSGGGGSSAVTYPVSNTTAKAENGTISLDKANAKAGAVVTVTASPDAGYEVDAITVTDAGGRAVKVTDNGDGTYRFTMPAGKVTVEASFQPVASSGNALPFVDVPKDSWAYDAILYAYENNLFAGTSATTFGFGENMTRQQMWMVLARMSGAAPATMDAARTWAMENIASDGTNPTGSITREQFVTLLWRYAGSPASSKDLSGYTDFNTVSAYAKTAMAWAVENGIVSGTSAATLSPAATATRAQVAVILAGYCQNGKG